MKFLITGSAGFIGYHLSKKLLSEGHEIVGIDNINNFYSSQLKYDRLKDLGISETSEYQLTKSSEYENLLFAKIDLRKKDSLNEIFNIVKYDKIIHLAALPGVRQSVLYPNECISNNIEAFINVIECAKTHNTDLIYASSSSVYGSNKKLPHSETDSVDNPCSLYAASKRSNELIAKSYSSQFGFKAIGLRFFTVYGPWGRPDMAYYSFTEKLIKGEKITLFNEGKMFRDFTYIDDVISGINKLVNIDNVTDDIFNIGNSYPVSVLKMISIMESIYEKKAIIEFKDLNSEVKYTYSDNNRSKEKLGYEPTINLDFGMRKFSEWFFEYSKKESVC